MRRALLALLICGGLAVPATANAQDVPILYDAFGAPKVNVVAGDAVTWHNDSVRAHIVSSTDGSFASDRLFAQAMYTHQFATPGTFGYYCPLHPGMRGEVDVHRALLDAPKDAAAPGKPFRLTGRAAGKSVTIQPGDITAPVADDGTFSATVKPAQTTAYTASVDGDTSPAVQVLVLDRKIAASARGSSVSAKVMPASAGATVVLQMHLKERFGWWPVARAKLGKDSRVRFTVHRRGRVRVVLVASDEATPLATSAALSVR